MQIVQFCSIFIRKGNYLLVDGSLPCLSQKIILYLIIYLLIILGLLSFILLDNPIQLSWPCMLSIILVYFPYTFLPTSSRRRRTTRKNDGKESIDPSTRQRHTRWFLSLLRYHNNPRNKMWVHGVQPLQGPGWGRRQRPHCPIPAVYKNKFGHAKRKMRSAAPRHAHPRSFRRCVCEAMCVSVVALVSFLLTFALQHPYLNYFGGGFLCACLFVSFPLSLVILARLSR